MSTYPRQNARKPHKGSRGKTPHILNLNTAFTSYKNLYPRQNLNTQTHFPIILLYMKLPINMHGPHNNRISASLVIY